MYPLQVSSLKLEPDWSVSSSLSFSPAQFSTFLSLATPAGLVMGAAALLLALAVELKQSRSPYEVGVMCDVKDFYCFLKLRIISCVSGILPIKLLKFNVLFAHIRFVWCCVPVCWLA